MTIQKQTKKQYSKFKSSNEKYSKFLNSKEKKQRVLKIHEQSISETFAVIHSRF